MKASDLFVKALEDEGVDYIFGVRVSPTAACPSTDVSIWQLRSQL